MESREPQTGGIDSRIRAIRGVSDKVMALAEDLLKTPGTSRARPIGFTADIETDSG
jgi:hypothetical protein